MTALVAVGPAPQANAAFSTGKCAGDNIIGRGASFARDAHGVFNGYFKLTHCTGTPGAGKINVTYEAQGSGAGRTAVKVRNDSPRFGMTDEPPVPLEIAQMNTGVGSGDPATDANPNDNGVIHVIPAAVGAVAPLVNFPNDCDVGLLDAASRTPEEMSGGGTPFPLGLVRVRFTKDEFEKIWAKEATHDNWVEVFPELNSDADCNKPIIRIVRFDESGTSFAFKDNLRSINEGRGWLTTFGSQGTGGTRRWPGFGADGGFGVREDCPKVGNPPAFPSGPGSDSVLPGGKNPGEGVAGPGQLTSACFNGNQGVVDKLVATDGSVGYSDISTARRNPTSLAITPRASAGAAFDNDLYWTQIPSGPGAGTFQEPTADAKGFRTDGNEGSNCQAANFTNQGNPLPTTLEDWSKVSGVNSVGAYAVCSLTYALVFEDNADVWGNTPGEESKARTVKDYWESSLTTNAQAQLFTRDYSPLPIPILEIAKAGIAQVDWNKGTGGGGPGGGGPGAGGNTPPAGGGGTPPPVKPSNLFSMPKKSISSKTGGATISVKLPGSGKLELVGSAKNGKAKIKVGRVVLTANKAGTFDLALKPSAAAKKVLRDKGSLKVTLSLTFTPTGGEANTSTSSLTLKLKKGK
ncbi:MAG TPA: substrate-binding domain-containing protein [Solirubrobacterales bacterium]|nr:substrate-binding domain-containing protein [Solirubrobacterales bacterium]